VSALIDVDINVDMAQSTLAAANRPTNKQKEYVKIFMIEPS
jgi:hypothetical protein